MTVALVTARAIRVVTVSSTTLYQVAADELGDALQWTRIARLNGLSDPWISDAVTLKIPNMDPAADTGGVLL